MNQRTILIVDDEPRICEQLSEILSEEGYRVTTAASAPAAREITREESIDLALVDIWMPGEDGLHLLKFWKRTNSTNFPVLMMSGHGNITTAIEAIQLGAAHFLEKPLNFQTLLLEVKRTLEVADLREENQKIFEDHAGLTQIIGNHPDIIALRTAAQDLGSTPVLIIGEDGCEHQELATLIHRESPHRAGPFVSNLHTDADAASNLPLSKLLTAAQGGTLFLNALDQFTAKEHNALLNVLRNDNPRDPAHIRVIATLDQLPSDDTPAVPDAVREHFAKVLTIPPLRNRTQDITELVDHFMRVYCAQENLPWRAITPPILQILEAHHWPGNVQELRHCVHQLLHNPDASEDVDPEELDTILYPRKIGKLITRPYREARADFDLSYFEFHLQQSEGSIARLSARTGMDRTYLYRKLKELGLRTPNASRTKPDDS